MKKKILAICPHADDIELNFASTLIKYRKEYDYTIGYIMTTDNASGGVSTMEDVRQLRQMNIYGAIIGKAYYTGAIDLKEALEAAK